MNDGPHLENGTIDGKIIEVLEKDPWRDYTIYELVEKLDTNIQELSIQLSELLISKRVKLEFTSIDSGYRTFIKLIDY